MPNKSNPYSYLKVFRHKDKIDALSRGEITSPLSVQIQPTSLCNHRCHYCSYRNPEAKNDHVSELRSNFKLNDQLSQEIITDLIRDVAQMKVKAIIFSGGGEPLMYPYIEEAMRAVLENNMDLALITNGHFLSEGKAEILRHAKWVRISMDTCRSDRYAEIRGIKEEAFHIITENIRRFSKRKSDDCELGINFVIGSDNSQEVYEMASFAKGLGVNHVKYCAVIVQDIAVLHDPIKQQVIQQIERAQQELVDKDFKIINKYSEDMELNAVFQRIYSRCPAQQIAPVVGSDANVYFCHDKAYVPQGSIGSLKEKSFKEIWFSKETKKRFGEFDARKECCHHCVYDQRNMLLNNYLDLDDSQINFI